MDQRPRRPKVTKLLERNIEVNPHNFWIWQWFLRNDTKKHKRIKRDKLECIKIKNFCISKDTQESIKTIPQNEKDICSCISDTGQLARL